MSLSALISEKSNETISQEVANKAARTAAIKEKLVLLLPIIDELNIALPDYGLKAYAHTDPSHLPCPAIHIRNGGSATQNMAIYDKISEICLGEGSVAFHSGSCNQHKYSHPDKASLFNHIADAISKGVASKRLVSK